MFSGLPEDYQSVPIKNDGFWPDLDTAQFQAQRSIPASIKSETVTYSLLAAIGEVNNELAKFAADKKQSGIEKASDVPGASAGGINQLCAQYTKAVYARAKAELMGEITSAEREKANPGQISEDTRDKLLAEASYTIRNILGYHRIGVYLV